MEGNGWGALYPPFDLQANALAPLETERLTLNSSVDKSGDWRLALELYEQLRADMAEDAAGLSAAEGGGGDNQDTTTRPDTPLSTGQALPPPRVTVAALTACAR